MDAGAEDVAVRGGGVNEQDGYPLGECPPIEAIDLITREQWNAFGVWYLREAWAAVMRSYGWVGH